MSRTQPKFTPGPWHRNIKPASKYTTVWAGRNTHVAYVATSGLSEEEIEGNINVIATAPMGYELAQLVVEKFADYYGYEFDAGDVALLEKARSIIAAIEGDL